MRSDRKLEFEIYRKPTDSKLLINANSFHHPSHKHAAFHSMFHRLFNIPMKAESFEKKLKYIKDTAKLNGFDEKLLLRNNFKRFIRSSRPNCCDSLSWEVD
jgi:hypothetical protein